MLLPLFTQATIRIIPLDIAPLSISEDNPPSAITQSDIPAFISLTEILDSDLSVLDGFKELSIPPERDKTLPANCTGKLWHSSHSSNWFIFKITLNGLEADRDYVLTLNGKPDLPGNDSLPTLVPGRNEERYYDLTRIHTNADGQYAGVYAVQLKPGNYQLRFYVKDTTDWTIVLYRDFFPFCIQP